MRPPQPPRARTAHGSSSSAPHTLDPGIVVHLQRATHAVGLRLEARLAELGVSQGEAHILALLSDGRPRPVGELRRSLAHRPSTLSGILDRLEQRRLVTRRLNDADRRSLLVTLTRRGRAAALVVAAALLEVEAETRRRLTARDLEGFRAVLVALTGPRPADMESG